MADGQDDGQEKTLDPTPKKLEQAREKGDVPRSTDAHAAAAYAAFVLVAFVAGGAITLEAAAPLAAMLASPEALATEFLRGAGELSARMIGATAVALAPLVLAPLAAILLSLAAQRAIVVSVSKIEPKLSKISPISNAQQKFGPTGLMEFAKSVVKMLAIAGVLAWIFATDERLGLGLMRMEAQALPTLLGAMAATLLIATLAVQTLIALLDLMWQRYDHQRKLRMSFQEMKDETKESEGDPTMKGTRQRRGREIALNQQLADVPGADVVVVNPTHYAVALKWSRAPGSAPICVAKGVDFAAMRIREVAEESGVPIHRDPPTARALHASMNIGDEIPEEQFRAVAAAIRFSDAVRRRRRGQSWRR